MVDEFGGTEGIITMADIVEDILSDAAPLGAPIFTSNRWKMENFSSAANARSDDLSERLGFEVDAEGIDTIGGLVFNRLGLSPDRRHASRSPEVSVTVSRTGRKRIRELLLEKTAALDVDETSE